MELNLHNGNVVSIAHLAEKQIACPCQAINRDMIIKVVFKNHCYTEVWDSEKHSREEILLYDTPEKPRAFCPIRHGLSLQLPALIDDLPGRKVYQTAEARNYVYVVSLTVSNRPYEIYFQLQRAQPDDEADLRLTVESAYLNEDPITLKKRPREIRFLVLAQKVLMRQQVKFAAR